MQVATVLLLWLGVNAFSRILKPDLTLRKKHKFTDEIHLLPVMEQENKLCCQKIRRNQLWQKNYLSFSRQGLGNLTIIQQSIILDN